MNTAKVIEMNKTNEVRDEEFEKELDSFITKKKIGLAKNIIGLYLVGIVMVLVVAGLFWTYWRFKTNSDVLYLVGWYLILGNFCNLVIFAWIDTMVGSIRKAGLQNIKSIRKTARRRHYNSK